MEKLKPDYTAVVREDGETHILKAKILNDKELLFQMFNKTNNKTTPCFKIKADFGLLKMTKGNRSKTTDDLEERLAHTDSVDRARLVMYFKQFKLQWLVGKLHENWN